LIFGVQVFWESGSARAGHNRFKEVAMTDKNSSIQDLLAMALRSCQVAHASAEALLDGINTRNESSLQKVFSDEDELDTLNRQVNEAVIRLIPETQDAVHARELIACLKFVIELERIGDLFLNVVNRFRAAAPRLHPTDIEELAGMTSLVASMLGGVEEAFASRDVARAIAVLREDAELDRRRNLMIVRHVENPENLPVEESYHMVFMAQILERSGDHVKHLAEEICHLVTGRSARHLQREYEKPREILAMERNRKAKQSNQSPRQVGSRHGR
jgi:phosphate uptake regulator